MIYEYDAEADETTASVDGETFATMDGQVTRWRDGMPHPNTDWFENFEAGLLQLDTPTERKVILHLIAGQVERVGFEE